MGFGIWESWLGLVTHAAKRDIKEGYESVVGAPPVIVLSFLPFESVIKGGLEKSSFRRFEVTLRIDKRSKRTNR